MNIQSKNKFSSKKVVVFSVASKSYKFLYNKCIKSHRDYAKKFGYEYIIVDKFPIWADFDICAWTRVPVILNFFKNKYDWVFYIDSDCEIKASCPSIETLQQDGKDIYMCLGYSGRLNSGVILTENTDQSKTLFETILKNCDIKVPPEDACIGENGHFIYFLKNKNNLQILDRRWNNNIEPDLPDFIRHYSAGPMRHLYKTSLYRVKIFNIYKKIKKVLAKINNCFFKKELVLLSIRIEKLIEYYKHKKIYLYI